MAFGTVTGTFQGNNASIPASFAAALSTGSGVVATGDLVVAVISEQTALTVSAVTDNLGNTYTAQNAGTLSGTSVSGRAFYSRVTNAGTITSVTATCTSSTDNGVIVAAIIQGPFAAPPIDANPANVSDVVTPYTANATGTLAQASEVVVSWVAKTGSGVFTGVSPTTVAVQQASVSVVSALIATQTVTATTSVAPAFTGTAPTADVIGAMSFQQAAPFPNGWQRGADNLKAAVGVWPMLLLATQATNFATPPPASNTIVGTGWYQQLSSAAPVAQAQQGLSVVPFNTPQVVTAAPNTSGWLQPQSAAPKVAQAKPTQATAFAVPPNPPNSITGIGWHQPLSSAAPVARAQAGNSFVPFNTAQAVASQPSGWQTIQSAAPKRAVINASALTFVVAPFNVPSGWQSQLSVAPPVAKVQLGSTVVPFKTTQAAQTPPPNGWFGPINPAAPTARAQPTQATSFAVPPQTASTPTPAQFGWYAPLSKAVAVAQAQQGYSFVPFNTVQQFFSTAQTVPLYQDAGTPRTAIVYYQSSFNPLRPPAAPSNTVTQLAWQQPLSVAVKSATVAPQGSTFVPLNTAQFVPPPPLGWWQPLSVAAKSKPAIYTQPVWTPTAFPTFTLAWVQPLSKAVPVTRAHQGNAFVPLNTVQIAPTPISGMAWFMPLGTVAFSIPTAPQGWSFVPFDTAQFFPPPPPPPPPFHGWTPATKTTETWADVSGSTELWTPAIKTQETWTDLANVNGLWIPAIKTPESWTDE